MVSSAALLRRAPSQYWCKIPTPIMLACRRRTLWICVTTANYPDVMMPGYNEHRLVAVFFVSFMVRARPQNSRDPGWKRMFECHICRPSPRRRAQVFSFFYLMNLVLAITVNAYDECIEERKSSRSELSKKLLTEAFHLLDHDGDNSVSRDNIMHVS